jgi:hypothetical protein
MAQEELLQDYRGLAEILGSNQDPQELFIIKAKTMKYKLIKELPL